MHALLWCVYWQWTVSAWSFDIGFQKLQMSHTCVHGLSILIIQSAVVESTYMCTRFAFKWWGANGPLHSTRAYYFPVLTSFRGMVYTCTVVFMDVLICALFWYPLQFHPYWIWSFALTSTFISCAVRCVTGFLLASPSYWNAYVSIWLIQPTFIFALHGMGTIIRPLGRGGWKGLVKPPFEMGNILLNVYN